MNSIAAKVIGRGGRVTYLRWDDGRQIAPLDPPRGVTIHDIRVTPKIYPWHVVSQQRQFCRGLRRHFSADRPDLVHTNFCLPGSATRRLAKREYGIPVLSSCHELYDSMNVYLRANVRRTQTFADRIVYISQTVARSYGAKLDGKGEPRDRRERVIPNGLDTASIRRIAESAGNRCPQLIVSVGRLVAEKGFANVIRSLPVLRNEFPQIHYRIVGDGPERANLAEFAYSLDVSSQVEFVGWLPYEQTITQMAIADTVAVPSTHEGFGLALVEAICCGSKLVASDIPAFAEIMADERHSVRFFSEGDVADLTQQLRTALRSGGETTKTNDALLKSMAERFSAERMAEMYVQVYSELAG